MGLIWTTSRIPDMRLFLPLAILALTCATSALAEPPTLEFSKWSGALNVPDPVAISFDDVGRAYVTQTQRRKSQDLDIRNNRVWIEQDVSFETVEEKRRLYL